MKKMKMRGKRLPSGNVVLKWKESLPTVATMGGQQWRTSLVGGWTVGAACWWEANLTLRLLLFPLELWAGPGSRQNPWKAQGRRCGRCLGKERSPRGPELCGMSWVGPSRQTEASSHFQGMLWAQASFCPLLRKTGLRRKAMLVKLVTASHEEMTPGSGW